jgi:sugar phosphate isomerase/epimerase
MAPGSIDDKVKFLTMARYEQAVRIASDLGAKIVVLHANFIAAIRTEDYRRTWQSRNIDFWGRLGDFAERHSITLAIENMWEFHPDIIGDVLRAVEHARVRACLDVGHAHLYSEVSFDMWLSRLGPYVVHLHINNNPGDLDFHQGLHQGVLDYRSLLPRLRALPHTPSMTLEMDTVSDMSESLELLELT